MKGTLLVYRGEYNSVSDFTSKNVTRHGEYIFVKYDGFYINKNGTFERLYLKQL